jgi:predicted methyltransferase
VNYAGPLVTVREAAALAAARGRGLATLSCSLDLDRSREEVALGAAGWTWRGGVYPYPEGLRERTVYYWDGAAFAPASRYSGALIKLVPTEWGPPTFEIDGIKMLPTAQVSPWDDARDKVALVAPRGKAVLDTCGGLGYFAAWCLAQGAASVHSYEKNADVLWLRRLNPWSPEGPGAADPHGTLALVHGDVAAAIDSLPSAAFDAALHDPPRFGIAGELYSAAFYAALARVLRPGARLFHYTGTPNRLTSGRDVPGEVKKRLDAAGFRAERHGDGVLAVRARR